MCEFNGTISGKAEKFFLSKSKKVLRNIVLFAMASLLPIFIYLAITDSMWKILIVYCSVLVASSAIAIIPISTKRKAAILPKRIYTDNDGYIVCMTNESKEYRQIADAKRVIDHGDFYEIIFPFGKYSEKFICQKNLLVKGTVEEFESLFEGKIVKK